MSAFNPPTPTYRVAPSRKGANAPDAASSAPTRSLGRRDDPSSSHSDAIASNLDPGVAVKYWVE